MIDFVLEAELRAGANRKVDLGWTNWTYLLPRIDIDTALADWEIPEPVLDGLARLGVRVERRLATAGLDVRADLLITGPGGSAREQGFPGPILQLGESGHGAAQLGTTGGAPALPVHALEIPLGSPRRHRATALGARVGRVARRAARRARLVRPAPDRAERATSLAVVASEATAGLTATLSVPNHDLRLLPAYVAAAANGANVAPSWRILLEGEYRSQKIVFFTGDVAIKVARDPAFSRRLDNEHAALATVFDASAVAPCPAPRFQARHAGLSIVGQSAINGERFSASAQWHPGDPLAGQVLDTLAILSRAPLRGTASADEATRSLHGLVRRYTELYRPDPALLSFLQARLADVSGTALPTVFEHGDPGTWNIVLEGGAVRLLDWENGEVRGMPTWDASAFVHAYTARALAHRGMRASPSTMARVLFADTEWSRWHAAALQRAAGAVGLPQRLVAPILALHYVYQAVKEIPRLDPDGVAHGQANRMLRECRRAWGGVAISRLREV